MRIFISLMREGVVKRGGWERQGLLLDHVKNQSKMTIPLLAIYLLDYFLTKYFLSERFEGCPKLAFLVLKFFFF